MSQQTYTPTHCPQTGRKFTRAERKAANKAKYALERAQAQAEREASKAKQAVKNPHRNSNDGIEQSQARKHTANKVGKAVKTKVVHAITEGKAQPFEPRKEVIVPERKVVKRAQMRVTLLPGETPEEGIRRMKIQQAQAEAEACRIEAENLLNVEL